MFFYVVTGWKLFCLIQKMCLLYFSTVPAPTFLIQHQDFTIGSKSLLFLNRKFLNFLKILSQFSFFQIAYNTLHFSFQRFMKTTTKGEKLFLHKSQAWRYYSQGNVLKIFSDKQCCYLSWFFFLFSLRRNQCECFILLLFRPDTFLFFFTIIFTRMLHFIINS